MSERVEAYFAMLKSRTSEDLDRSARALALREKHDVARLIAHIAEIGERDYHLELSYKSLFAARKFYGHTYIGEKIDAARRETVERTGLGGVP